MTIQATITTLHVAWDVSCMALFFDDDGYIYIPCAWKTAWEKGRVGDDATAASLGINVRNSGVVERLVMEINILGVFLDVYAAA
jgi:hypothetical protein